MFLKSDSLDFYSYLLQYQKLLNTCTCSSSPLCSKTHFVNRTEAFNFLDVALYVLLQHTEP